MTVSEFSENLRVSWDTIRSHKVRSGLTLLGIVIGVTSVISVAAIIGGLNSFIAGKVEQLGSRTYYVARFPAGTPPFNLPERFRVRKHLEYDYGKQIRESVPGIASVTVMGTRASFFGGSNEIRYGSERVERVFLRGAEADYVEVLPLFSVEYGRFYTPDEDKRSAQVVVIGAAIAESLFPGADPVGKNVLLNGSMYEVIGVFAHDAGFLGGPGVDQFALIPLSNFRKHNPDIKELFLAFSVRPGYDMESVKDRVVEVLRRIRRVPPSTENDFEVFSSDFLSNLWNQLTGAIVVLTGVISSIGLLVGGIGVMNIMLISVTERTKEIGVRKAIGARSSDIRVQFLLEATMLTLAGGAIGILLGAAVAWTVRTVMPSIPAVVSPLWITLGVAMSAGVGLFFGYYPADRAARLDPIVCLRYE